MTDMTRFLVTRDTQQQQPPRDKKQQQERCGTALLQYPEVWFAGRASAKRARGDDDFKQVRLEYGGAPESEENDTGSSSSSQSSHIDAVGRDAEMD